LVPGFLLVVTGMCLVGGAALHFVGAGALGNLVWIFSGALGALYASWSVLDSLVHRRLGVDVIALLALVGAMGVFRDEWGVGTELS